ncbi:disease resistance protein RPV1 isoform X2 [Daucus carota subsp. sativus]|uniref:disease resistance protein RPV1 isoform X2 n=1 Tax=Daucus carota subsp. sativus TaxID=79200 RepID=UPI0007F02FA2|nr:PREDICTED: TMV resistance protein N-like isoform X2 [Daucus carota subsp. sativus]
MSTSYSQTPVSAPSTWDVFLSFRGKDTRNTFTSHLYAAFERAEIRTFKDDSELHKGEEISDSLFQAIQESKSYVVVLSENYANSSWCLNELAEILSCCKTTGRSLTPVFYMIDPSVVRHQKDSYKKAFDRHLIDFGKEKVDRWRLTLFEVANLSGYHVSGDRYEIDIVNEIVDGVLLEINPKTLYVAEYPVGLASRVKKITTLVESFTEGIHGGTDGLAKTTLAEKISICGMGGLGKTTSAKKIGIYGMGGVGKTTLAKAFYNENYRRFQGSCFLENVRDVSRKEGLECLQQQLLNNVLKCQNINVYNVDQGIEFIRARICSMKVLIVIDDLDDPRQLEYLEGRFALGSIMIITTRNEDLLDSIEVEARYKVNELNDAESFQLFSLHAFGNNMISDTLMEISQEILQQAGGLPLALKVFGSDLLKQRQQGVTSVDELKRVSIDAVEEKLKISFDALKFVDPMLQDIFLDIACFFIGWDREDAVEIMDAYYSYVDHKIDILQKRCLLTINDRDKFVMHDLIRDIGREVIRKNSLGEPGDRSRLWESKDICDVLKKEKGTNAIEVIIHQRSYRKDSYVEASIAKETFKKVIIYQNSYHQDPFGEASFTTETFKRMSKLRFLHLDCVELTGSFEEKFENLRWLCWKWCPLEYLPSTFYPQKLVILELPHSKLRTMWEVSQVFKKLKTLNMWRSLDLTCTPDFTILPFLENLNLEGCESLEEVHVSIGSLATLVSLNLGGCVNLRSLPDSICNLGALKSLNIVDCSRLVELPLQLGNIGCMKELIAEGLNVSKIPDSIGQLTKLVELRLSCNKYLKTFPDTIDNLRSLKILDISYCNQLEILPYQLLKLTRLSELYARGASLAKQLPQKNFKTALYLKKLFLSDTFITNLPSVISQLPYLEVLSLKGCRRLSSIPELPTTLIELRAEDCTSMLQLPNLSNLKQLEMLELTGCSGLEEIQGLEELTSLRELPLGGCNSSLMAYTFTQHLFQIYSGFGHEVKIYARSAEFPDWISRSRDSGSTVTLDLQPDVSQNFLGMILCFKYCDDEGFYRLDYSVKTTTSNLKCSYDGLYAHYYNESWMVVVPRSVFTVTDADYSIELVANQDILGVHLLYKMEIPKIEHDSTKGQVQDEGSYPFKRLKHLISDN